MGNLTSKKFFYAWIACTLVMFSCSYLWHGVILNDLRILSFPLNIFLTAASLAYLLIGFIITAVISHLSVKENSYALDLKVGSFIGASIYLIAFVFGISFHSTVDIKGVLVDGSWQIMEQMAGALIGGYVFRIVAQFEGLQQTNSPS